MTFTLRVRLRLLERGPSGPPWAWFGWCCCLPACGRPPWSAGASSSRAWNAAICSMAMSQFAWLRCGNAALLAASVTLWRIDWISIIQLTRECRIIGDLDYWLSIFGWEGFLMFIVCLVFGYLTWLGTTGDGFWASWVGVGRLGLLSLGSEREDSTTPSASTCLEWDGRSASSSSSWCG